MTMASLIQRMTVALAAFILAFGLAACEEQGTVEQTGEAVDSAIEQSAGMVEEGAQELEEGTEKVDESAD